MLFLLTDTLINIEILIPSDFCRKPGEVDLPTSARKAANDILVRRFGHLELLAGFSTFGLEPRLLGAQGPRLFLAFAHIAF